MKNIDSISAKELRNKQPATGPHPLLDSLNLRTGYSSSILTRMIIAAAIIVGVILWQLDLVRDIYTRHQIEGLGILINGSILALFAIGITKLMLTFMRYVREESAIAHFVRNARQGATDPTRQVPANSIIVRRYQLMKAMFEQRALINHSALASMLLASESTRTSMTKFINNILILAGVFGTIVSLSIALLGASDLLITSGNTGGMSQVLSGMSTALSTTITAIICYLYFGYFFIKVNDVQTSVINNIEQITATLLIPRFNLQRDTVMQDVAILVRDMQKLVSKLDEAQSHYSASGQKLLDAVSSYSIRGQSISNDIAIIKELLRSGFRLYEHDQEDG